MEPLKILESHKSLDWKYDEDADVLYVSIGKPSQAQSLDIGNGLVVRYDEAHKEVVGLTILGFRARALKGIADAA